MIEKLSLRSAITLNPIFILTPRRSRATTTRALYLNLTVFRSPTNLPCGQLIAPGLPLELPVRGKTLAFLGCPIFRSCTPLAVDCDLSFGPSSFSVTMSKRQNTSYFVILKLHDHVGNTYIYIYLVQVVNLYFCCVLFCSYICLSAPSLLYRSLHNYWYFFDSCVCRFVQYYYV